MESIPPYLRLVIVVSILICLVLSFLFTAAENAFSNCNKYYYKVLGDENNFKAKLIYKMCDKFDDSLITALLGNNLSQTIISYISAFIFLCLANKYNLASGSESILSTLFLTIILYFFADYLPKIISKVNPNLTCEIVIYPIIIFYYLFLPIILFFKLILNLVKKITNNKDDLSITKEEFIDHAKEASEEVLEDEEKQILNKAIKFDKINVKQVLTPKEKIYSININKLTNTSLHEKILKTNYSRIPIFENRKNNIIGILNVKTYFKEYMEDKHFDVRSILNEPLKVSQNEKVDDIFKKFNKEKTHLALVYDNDNSLIGMVTMQDILEELIDNIDEPLFNNEDSK